MSFKPIVLNETAVEIVGALQDLNRTLGGKTKHVIYGFHVDSTISNPSDAVTYLNDAVGATPAYMDYTNNVFRYGSWSGKFFMPKPCMVKSDGTVDYYLDPTDYTKKVDGSASDVANTSYDGNAMMEWGDGNSIIWTKIVPDSSTAYSYSVYISNYQADSGYTCYPFINKQGNQVSHFYTPIYNGSLDSNNKLRSISGQVVCQSKTAAQERTYAQTNGAAWDTEFWCDIQLINALTILLGKSLDSQSVFGLGNQSGYVNDSSVNYGMLSTGSMNTKGLFWGKNTSSSSDNSGVKVFGMENYWGNQWRRFVGLINVSGTVKAKLTYGTQDGSTVTDYNTDGTGYIDVGVTPSGSSGGYINQAKAHTTGIYPSVASGSSSTYYCDGLWFNNSQTDYAYRGGDCSNGARCGLSDLALDYAAGNAYWTVGAAPSCKPLV